jgi:hypothetical protein
MRTTAGEIAFHTRMLAKRLEFEGNYSMPSYFMRERFPLALEALPEFDEQLDQRRHLGRAQGHPLGTGLGGLTRFKSISIKSLKILFGAFQRPLS